MLPKQIKCKNDLIQPGKYIINHRNYIIIIYTLFIILLLYIYIISDVNILFYLRILHQIQ